VYLAVAFTPADAVTFMASALFAPWHKARVTGPSPTATPGHGGPEDAVVIALAYGATATTAFANRHEPDGLADEERQSAACPFTGEEASHDK
jgi:hypothetical protein